MNKKILLMVMMLGLMGVSQVTEAEALEWEERTLQMILEDINKKDNGNVEYEIKWGDTLSLISEALGVDIDTLAEINKVEDKDLIIAGSKLYYNADKELLLLEEEDGEYLIYNIEEEQVEEKEELKEVFKEEISELEHLVVIDRVEEWIPEEKQEDVKEEETEVIIEEILEEVKVEETEVITEEILEDEQVEKTEVESTEEILEETEEILEDEHVESTEEVLEVEQGDLVEETEEILEEEQVESTELNLVEDEILEETEEILEDEILEETELNLVEEVQVEETELNLVEEPSNNNVVVGDPYTAFNQIATERGITEEERVMWEYIITRESGWNVTISNQYSGAYGLPQALPGDKMASHGADWETNPYTQLNWMLDYMIGRYGSIKGAYDFWESNRWY